jgi:regulatory protein
MKITKIAQQKRSSRVNVFIDDKFAFGLSKKTLIDFDLYEGEILNEKEIEKILEKDQLTKAIEKSFRLLGIRPRSQKELEKKLKEKGFAQKIIKKAIKRIKNLGYLDDKKFAKAWLEARKSSSKGKYIVERELKQKGIAEKIVKKTISYYTQKDEFKIANQLVKKKEKTYKKLSPLEKKIKISRFLANRGFSWEVIRKVLEKI